FLRDPRGCCLDRRPVGDVDEVGARGSVGLEIEDRHPGPSLPQTARDLCPELSHPAGDDGDAIAQREERVLRHPRCASQTPSQNSRTHPAPPGRERTHRASGFTSAHASAGTTGTPTARRQSASLTSLPTYAVAASSTLSAFACC